MAVDVNVVEVVVRAVAVESVGFVVTVEAVTVAPFTMVVVIVISFRDGS